MHRPIPVLASRSFLFLQFLLLLVLLLAGCGDNPTGPEEPEEPEEPVVPSITIETPDGEQSGDVTLSFNVDHPEGDQVDLVVSFTTSESDAQPATLESASSGTVEEDSETGVPSRIEGVPSGEHSFVWDSEADLEGEEADGIQVHLEWIDPESGAARSGDETEAFIVDNSVKAPTISIETPEEEQNGDVRLSFEVDDLEGNLTDLVVSFTMPESDAQPATVKSTSVGTVTEDAETGVPSRIEGVPSGEHTFVWDSEADLPERERNGIQMHLDWIDPESGESQPGDETEDFNIDNSKQVLWRFYLEEGASLRSSPIVVDGVVYVGASDYLYAVDAETGEEEWRFQTDGSTSSPVVADGTVYFSSPFDHLYAVDAETGQELWYFQWGSSFSSAPVVADGVVYFGSWDHNLYAVDTETGNELWSFQAEDNIDINTSPTVADGVVYFGSWDHNLYAVDTETGNELWSFEARDHVSSPVVDNGVVYAGSSDNRLYAVDAETGEEMWYFQTGNAIGSSPAVADGVAYVGSTDDHLYAVDTETGDELWRFQTEDDIKTSPVVAEGVVYVGSDDNYFYAVDAKAGEELWRFGTSYNPPSSPTVVNGVVYVVLYVGGLDSPYLYAME